MWLFKCLSLMKISSTENRKISQMAKHLPHNSWKNLGILWTFLFFVDVLTSVYINVSQLGVVFVLQRTRGNVWKHFCLSQLGMGVRYFWHLVGEVKNITKHHTIHRMSSPPPPPRIIQLEIPMVSRLRNPGLQESIENLTVICLQNTLDKLHVTFLLVTLLSYKW